MALIGHLQVATKTGAASATPNYRFERLTNMKPPALPGDIYFSCLSQGVQSRCSHQNVPVNFPVKGTRECKSQHRYLQMKFLTVLIGFSNAAEFLPRSESWPSATLRSFFFG